MTDYSKAWTQWGDMIRYSPAPLHRRRLVLALAREIDFASAMDVGCGNAALLFGLRHLRPEATLVRRRQRGLRADRANRIDAPLRGSSI